MNGSKLTLHFHKIIIFAGIVFLLIQMLVLMLKAYSFTGVWLSYPLDDTYIHLAVAKNMAATQTWGITSYGSTFCLSSPAYTFLLSLFMWFAGPQAWLAVGLNLLFCLGIIYQSGRFFISESISFTNNICLCIGIFLVILATPLASLALSGMEHTFHLFLVLLFFYEAIKHLDGSCTNFGSKIWLVCLPLLMLCRYESVFFILPFLGILLLQKRYKKVLLFGVLAFLPMGIYSLISVLNGWFFWPTSILLKNKVFEHNRDIFMVLSYSIKNLLDYSPILIGFLVLFGYIVFKFRKQKNGIFYMAMLLFVAAISQVFLAQVGWYRYECWVVGSGVLLLALYLKNILTLYHISNKFNFGLGILLCIGICGFAGQRSYKYLTHYPRAAANIYEQQMQMAKFIDFYYQGSSVAMNDIGAACWLSDFRLLDMYGLGSKQITDLLLQSRFDSSTLKHIFKDRNIDLIIAYPSWFVGKRKIPAYKVGTWQIRNNIICGSDLVCFYVPDISKRNLLKSRLKQYERLLPKQVIVQYFED